MTCKECGAEIPEGFKFCSECGTPVPEVKVCPNCNKEIPLAMKFCGFCGYNFGKNSNADNGGAGGLSMGDKNVIAGDVIGHSEDITVSGNATIVKNSDETKHVVKCHICGKNLTIIETHTCPICKESVCDDCYDRTAGMCNKCKNNNKASNENEYKEVLKGMLSDGIIDLQERRTLEALQKQLGISADKANAFENELRYGGNSESFTTMEKLSIEDATNIFYEEGDSQKAFELLTPVYEAHKYDERVLNIYLPVLEDIDEKKVVDVIKSLNADMLSASLVLIDIYTKNDLSSAERILDNAEKVWSNSLLLKCRRATWLYRMYKETKRDLFFSELTNVINSLPEPENKLERTWCFKCKDLLSDNKKFDKEKCKEADVYYGLLKKNNFKLDFSNITVNTDGTGDFTSINEALENVSEGGKICLMNGPYNETFNINKKVEIIGADDKKTEISIESGILCKINADAFVKNICFMNTNTVEKDKSEFGMVEIYSDCTFEECEFAGSFDSGIRIQGDGIKPIIKNCEIHNGRRNGAWCSGSSTPLFENCKVYENGNQGIIIKENSNPSVENCKVYENGNNGISIVGNSNPSVENCKVYENKNIGILVIDDATGNYKNCECYNNSTGIGIAGNANPVVDGCEIFDNEKLGIYGVEYATGIYRNCRIHGCYDNISIRDHGNPLIENCEVYDGKGNGILVRFNATGTYKNCRIHGNNGNNVAIVNEGNPFIENCEVYDGKQVGIIIGNQATGTYKNCKVYNNTYAGISVRDNANPVVDGCEVYNGKACGIVTCENATGTYKNCIIYGNAEGNDIYTNDNAAPTCINNTIR